MLTPPPGDPVARLRSLVAARSSEGISPAVSALADDLVARHGRAITAVLVYGSCYRTGAVLDGLVDLYVLVGRDGIAPPTGPRWMLRVLPPAVYFVESPVDGGTVRAKCAWLTLEAFERGTAGGQFLPSLWGRFAQPAGLVWARDEQARARVHAALARAVVTFVERTVGVLPARFDARDLWITGLRLSYGTELRAERPGTIEALYEADRGHYERVTGAAMAAARTPVGPTAGGPPASYEARIGPVARARSRLAWGARRWLGKLVSLLRLAKGLVTFTGGPEYILWKIERHSGVRVELSPRARRHPILAGWGALWRLYRRGAFR